MPPLPRRSASNSTNTDVIVNNWTDFPVKLEPDQPGVFPWMDQVFAFVREGGAYVGVHAASFERHPEFLRLAGLHWRDPSAGARITVDENGQIVRTPRGEGPGSGHGPLFVWPVTTRAPNHPVMSGLPAELPHVRDELWHGVRGPAEEMELLATAWSPVTQAHEPMLWTVRYGKGRVFMTLLGHDAEAMRDLTFRVTLARGAEWAASGRVSLSAPAAGPLRVHPDNPRYFTDGTQLPDGSLKAVYLTGAHTWNNLVDMGRSDPPEAFDFDAYLDFLEKHHHNFIRLWAWDSTVWDTRANGALGKDFIHHAAPLPWARTGPGNALGWQTEVRSDPVQPRLFRPAAFTSQRRRRARDLCERHAVRRLGLVSRQPPAGNRRRLGVAQPPVQPRQQHQRPDRSKEPTI